MRSGARCTSTAYSPARSALLLLLSCLLGLLVSCGPRQPVLDEEQVSPEKRLVLRFSHVVAENTPKGKAAQRFADLVNERLAGRVEVQVYANASLYTDSEEMQALIDNKVQLIAPATAKLSQWFPQWQLFDLPFLFADYRDVHRAMDGPAGKTLMKLLTRRGLLGLAMWDNGFKVMSATRPLRRVEDFAGLTFRVMPSPVLQAQFRCLGARTLPLDFSEVFVALESGHAHGAENPPSNLYSKGFYRVQPYVTVSNHGYLGYVVLTNATFWHRLPPEVRQVLEETMAEVTVWEREIAAAENARALALVEQSGFCQVIELPEEERERWRRAMRPVYLQFEDVIGPELLAAVSGNGTERE